MHKSAAKLRDFYAMKKNAAIFQTEFGFYSLDRWKKEGHIDDTTDLDTLFGYDEPGSFPLRDLGWCSSAFIPGFPEEVIEDRGEHEVAVDFAGRKVLYFKGRRSGFMPEYLDHPVKDMKTWETNCRWRLDPEDPKRYEGLEEKMKNARMAADQGKMLVQHVIGGYMYLRSLIGPVDLLYMFYDQPEVIHACMEGWLALCDKVIARHQEHVTLDELFIAEDICYNRGPLISPDMMREFLFPYYSQLIQNIKSRQKDRERHLYFQVDTDGFADPVIDLYRTLGMDYMSPFEVASGCDVVAIRKRYPDLLMRGGFDKRIIARGKEAIDLEVDRILPFMKEQGGYIPVCDHGVPEEVAFEDYMHYRKRIKEFG
ncbi:MAG: uroporphyrinogen decarboxylase family protein [Clostridia bacterium]